MGQQGPLQRCEAQLAAEVEAARLARRHSLSGTRLNRAKASSSPISAIGPAISSVSPTAWSIDAIRNGVPSVVSISHVGVPVRSPSSSARHPVVLNEKKAARRAGSLAPAALASAAGNTAGTSAGGCSCQHPQAAGARGKDFPSVSSRTRLASVRCRGVSFAERSIGRLFSAMSSIAMTSSSRQVYAVAKGDYRRGRF